MSGSADANLLLAAISSVDALHQRAKSHLRRVGRLRASVPAVLEAMMVTWNRRGLQQQLLAELDLHFELDQRETLFAAALALDRGTLSTVHDAFHAAEA